MAHISSLFACLSPIIYIYSKAYLHNIRFLRYKIESVFSNYTGMISSITIQWCSKCWSTVKIVNIKDQNHFLIKFICLLHQIIFLKSRLNSASPNEFWLLSKVIIEWVASNLGGLYRIKIQDIRHLLWSNGSSSGL